MHDIRDGGYSKRIGVGAPIYLAAVLEYLTAEALELTGNAAKDNKKQRINPQNIMLAIKNDDEFRKLLDDNNNKSHSNKMLNGQNYN